MLQSYEAIYDHGIMKWLGDQPADVEARVIVAILPNMTASSTSRMSHQPSSRIAGKCKVLADIVRRCPHPDIVGKIGIIGDVIDSAPVALLHDPEGSE